MSKKNLKKTKVRRAASNNLNIGRSYAGLGLFTKEPIKRGSFVIEYIGPILTAAEADKKGGKYLYQVNSRRAIDGSVRWNLARYLNHSCSGNCIAYNENSHIKIYARRNIIAGEELTYNYGREYFKDIIGGKDKCLCEDCRKKRTIKVKKLKNRSEK